MKTISIALLVLVLGLVIVGCSNTAPNTTTSPNTPTTPNTQAASNPADNVSVDTATTNPDIGTLDDTNVSDSLPQ